MSQPVILLFALLLDALLGEPDWLWRRWPHPAVVMGRVIGWLDARFNAGEGRLVAGAVGFGVVAVAAWVLGATLASVTGGWQIQLILAAILKAQKTLADHVGAVSDAQRLSVADGRLMVGRIVGRDTSEMDESAVARAAIESAAENLSDGVVAPAFWFLILGLPGLMVYKITNTADSMIGYRTPRYEKFGKAAARFDDVLNWVPARLTALLIALVYRRPDAWALIRRDAPMHRSPNAGWPEAAMAAILGIALSGPRSYEGEMREFPWVNGSGRRELDAGDIDAAVRVLWRVWVLILGLVAIIAFA